MNCERFQFQNIWLKNLNHNKNNKIKEKSEILFITMVESPNFNFSDNIAKRSVPSTCATLFNGLRNTNIKQCSTGQTVETFILIHDTMIHVTVTSKLWLALAPFNLCRVSFSLIWLFIAARRHGALQMLLWATRCSEFVGRWVQSWYLLDDV